MFNNFQHPFMTKTHNSLGIVKNFLNLIKDIKKKPCMYFFPIFLLIIYVFINSFSMAKSLNPKEV